MPLTADSFAALARSSPWRFSSLHFRYRCQEYDEDVEAWLERPGLLRVRRPDGSEYVERGIPESRAVMEISDSGVVSSRVVTLRPPTEFTPTLRDDGLVAQRPEDPELGYGDPMHGGYRWVAMLDPVELSRHVTITDVRADKVAGRTVWRARVAAAEGYDPRCGCCPLLNSWIAARDEHECGGPAPRPVEDYPQAYDVALDRQTGIVVSLEPVGGVIRDGFTVEIHDAR